jgi:hypothetical protein
MTRKKKYLQLLQSLLSDDPAVRSNQVILDSSDFVTLSGELREWLARQSYHWVQLDTSAKILQAKSDCSLSQEAKDLFVKWAYQAEKQYLASIQRSSDKEAFEKHITKIKRQSIKDLRDLGISKQIAERIFHNHLLIEIAAELELDFSGLGEQEGHKQALTDSLKRDFYPYDGTIVPYIDIGWFSTGKIYGPPRLPLESVFRKAPFPLKGIPATLYLISIDLLALGLGGEKQWKIGITKKSNILGTGGRSRFSGELVGAISIVDSIRFSDGRDAYFLEQKIIRASDEDRHFNKATSFKVRANPELESRIHELMAKNGYDYEGAVNYLKDLAKGLGLGPTEWVWKNKDEEFVETRFRSLTSCAPYFGEVVNAYTQGELML